MRWMLDLNVLLDVIQHRDPFYSSSAQVLTRVVNGEVAGSIPGHAVTTIHYVVRKSADQKRADEIVDWLLAHLDIVPQDRAAFIRARSLSFSDFEDAALASAAEVAKCDRIVTRNVGDFDGSPVSAITPEEILAEI
jgi:predicted nucleic acid-binding protein